MKTTASNEDAALLQRVANTDQSALSDLYDRYYRLVSGVAQAIVGDAAAAEEIALDVFVLVWKRAASYHPDRGRVSTWLIAITRHHAIDFLRHLDRRPESSSVSWEQYLSAHNSNSPREMEQNVEVALREQRIRAAIGQLPPDQQEALALAFFGGFTHREIADRLSQPLGTVKTRIRLAMHKLRGILQGEQVTLDASE
jgi:RNA polymerase sigma-70 factor (ECF subfamily)